MRLATPLLKRAVYPALHRTGLFNHSMPPSGFAVVNYHGIIPAGCVSDDAFLDGHLVTPEVFREQLRFLKANYKIVEPKTFRESIEQSKPLPPRAVLITCDDGLHHPLTEMLAVLQEEKVSCLFFVTAASCSEEPGMLWFEELYHLMRRRSSAGAASRLLPEEGNGNGTRNFQEWWWSAVRVASTFDAETRAGWMREFRVRYGSLPTEFEKRHRLLNLLELKRLSDEGMSIGAHTCTHPILAGSSEQEACREIQQGKLQIERAIGKPVWALAYPFGNPATMGDREFWLARQAGYSCAFLNVEHWEGQEMNPFAVCRTHVTSNMALPELAAHLSGVHARLQRVVGPRMPNFRKRSAGVNCENRALAETL
jgi:peptidoglycan/xylan/chitin deacetylase (PgdA/CDA1 family)